MSVTSMLVSCASSLILVDAVAATATRTIFGKLADGTSVDVVELTNSAGVKARIAAFGATLQSLVAPDRDGKLEQITLGYDTITEYEQHPLYLGVTVGRYANRIAGGRFTLDGQAYQLALNNGNNSLHGGTVGFDRRLWSIEEIRSGPRAASVVLRRISPDGEEGFPGNLDVRVTYTLTESSELSVSYLATTDRATIVNLTHHSLFNLAGSASGRSAMDSSVQIESDAYLPVDASLIPTGEIRPVAGTVFDFSKPVIMSRRVRDARDPQLLLGRGVDHNFVIRGAATATPRLACTVVDQVSGRGLRVLTTEPGLQVYTGNFLDGTVRGHNGQLMRQGDGIALEAQRYPDTPNRPAFPSARLAPGVSYQQTTVYQLFVTRR